MLNTSKPHAGATALSERTSVGKYSVQCLNLERFASSPSADVVIRLMWGINEMNQLADIARLLQTAEEEKPHLCKYYEGIKGGFTRQRSSKVGEVLDSIVRPLVADDALKKHPELVSLIDNDQILSRLREKLRRLFYGVFKDEFERHRQIRHRITEHFDHKTAFAVLPEAL